MAEKFFQMAAVENAIVLSEPGAGEVIRVQMSDKPLQFQFNMDSATFALEGNDLVITFANGGKIIIEDYVVDAPLGAGSIVAADGSELVPADIAVRLDGARVVEAPEAGEVNTLQVAQNEAFIFNFDPASAQIEVNGDDLILVFADGGRIVLEGFFAPGGESGSTPLTLLSDGSLLSGELITALAVEPAAGPAAPAATEGPEPGDGAEGGGGEFETPAITDYNSIDPLDPIGNEVFGSSVPEPIADQVASESTKGSAVKTGSIADGGPLVDEAGDIVNYTVKITNTGSEPLTGVVVNDPLVALTYASGDTNGNNELDPGETWVYTGSYVVPQSVIDNNGGGDGDIDNTVTVTTNETEFTASHEVGISRNPDLTIEKSAEVFADNEPVQVVTAAGDVIHYTIVVTNTGNVTLTGVDLDDPLINNLTLVSGDTDNDGNLDVGETWTYEGDYVVTQADIDSNGGGDGDIDNTATVDTDQTAPESDSVEVDIRATPSLEIIKEGALDDANDSGFADAGEKIVYTLSVTNTGAVSLTNVTVTDPDADAAPVYQSGDDGDGVLEVGETWVYGAEHTLTQEEIDSGSFTNVAIADSDESDPDDDDHTETLEANPVIDIVKDGTLDDVNDSGFAEAGEKVVYSITVTNEGNVSLSNITVTDPDADAAPVYVSGDTDGDNELDVDEVWTYSAEHTLTQEEIDSGSFTNVATADSGESDPANDDHTESLDANPVIDIVKEGSLDDFNGNEVLDAGDKILYTITVTNEGNVSLTNVTVADPDADAAPLFVGGDTDGDNELDVDETWTYSAEHTLTQDDIDSGSFTNTATADSDESAPADDSHTENLEQNPEIGIVKDGALVDGNDSGFADAGEQIVYTLTVTNEGNVTLHNIVVTDPDADAAPTYQNGDTDNDGNLDIGETWIYSATHTLTQEEIDSGSFTNVATADSDESDPADDNHTETLDANPVIDIVKDGALNDADDSGFADAGEQIDYTITITNQGNVSLTNVTVTDPDADSAPVYVSGDTDGDNELDVDETWTYTASHTLTQEEIDSGSFTNSATADSDESGPADDDHTETLDANAVIDIVKGGALDDADDSGFADAGEQIVYTLTVTNEGNVSLTNVTVTDPDADALPVYQSGDTDGDNELDVDETWVYSATHTLTQAEIDSGSFTNTATADSDESAPADDSHTETLDASGEIDLTKTGVFNDDGFGGEGAGDGKASLGETITYTFTIENTGNVTLDTVTLDDAALGINGLALTELNVTGDDGDGLLEVGETWTYTADYALVQADLDVAMKFNEATVEANDPADAIVMDMDDETVIFPVITSEEEDGTVYEAALPDGCPENLLPGQSTVATGTFTVAGMAASIYIASILIDGIADADDGTVVNGDEDNNFSVETDYGTFSVSLDGIVDGVATYTWTYELDASVEHDIVLDPTESFQVTLADGNTTASTDVVASISIVDDVPLDGQDYLAVENVIGTTGGDTQICFGADQTGAEVTSVGGTAPDGYSYVVQPDGQTIWVIADGDANDDPSFVLSVNDNGTYDFQVLKPVEPIEFTIGLNSNILPASGPTATTFDDPIRVDFPGEFSLSLNAFEIVGANNVDANINVSTDGIGINNNLVDDDEVLVLRFSEAGTDYEGNELVIYDATFGLANAMSDTMTIELYDPDGNLIASHDFPTQNTNADQEITVSDYFSDEELADGFSELHLIGVDSSAKVLYATIQQTQTPDDLTLEFTVSGTDGDGDVFTDTPIVIGLDADGDGNVTLNGTGSDNLVSGAGSNIYEYGFEGEGTDTISGFDTSDPAGTGDVLDISALLDGFGGADLNDAVTGGFVSFLTQDVDGDATDDLIVQVDADGAVGGGNFVNLVILDGATAVGSISNPEADLADNITLTATV